MQLGGRALHKLTKGQTKWNTHPCLRPVLRRCAVERTFSALPRCRGEPRWHPPSPSRSHHYSPTLLLRGTRNARMARDALRAHRRRRHGTTTAFGSTGEAAIGQRAPRREQTMEGSLQPHSKTWHDAGAAEGWLGSMVEQAIHFNDGDVYERTMGVWSRLAGELFLDWLNPRPGMRWIDVGCGSGAFTELLVQRCAPAETQGIDPSEAQARSRTHQAGGARWRS